MKRALITHLNLIGIGLILTLFSPLTWAIDRCEVTFLEAGKPIIPSQIQSRRQLVEFANTSYIQYYHRLYPEQVDAADVSGFNDRLRKNHVFVFDSDNGTYYGAEHPWDSSIFLIPSSEDFSSYDFVHSGLFTWQKNIEFTSADLSLQWSSQFTDVSHTIELQCPSDFPEYRSVLVNTDFLRQVNLESSWKPIVEIRRTYTDQPASEESSDTHLAFINWKKLAQATLHSPNPDALSAISNATWQFLLEQYAERFKFSDEFIKDVIEAGERVDQRVVTLVSSSNDLNIAQRFESSDSFPLKKEDLNGVFSMITSQSDAESLFFEIMEAIVYKRHHPRATKEDIIKHIQETFQFVREPGKKYAELGRLAVLQEVNPVIVPLLLQYLGAAALGAGVDEIIVYADRFHERLYRQYGFDRVHERVDQEGNKFYLLKQKPEIVLSKALTLFYRATTEDIRIPPRRDSEGDILDGMRAVRPPNDTRFVFYDIMEMSSMKLPRLPFEIIQLEVNKERKKLGLPPLPGTVHLPDEGERLSPEEEEVTVRTLLDQLKGLLGNQGPN